MHILEKDHDITKGKLFITNKEYLYFNQLKKSPDSSGVLRVSDHMFGLSLKYFTVAVPKDVSLLFLDVVYIPVEHEHYLRFLRNNEFLLFPFIKKKTFRNLRSNFTIIDDDKL